MKLYTAPQTTTLEDGSIKINVQAITPEYIENHIKNIEAVENLKDAEEMLGDKVSDRELFLMFDYEPEELERLRILAKYTGKLDTEEIITNFNKKYNLE